MKELFVKLYALNDDYHNNKERMIWLATTVYLGFALAVLGWLASHKSEWQYDKWPFIAFLSMVFLESFCFIFDQNWNKCRSVKIADQLNSLIGQFDSQDGLKYEDLEQATRYSPETPCKEKRRDFCVNGKPGIIILFAITTFFAAQIYFICRGLH